MIVSVLERKLDMLARMLGFSEQVLEWDELEREQGRKVSERTFSRGRVAAARKRIDAEKRRGGEVRV